MIKALLLGGPNHGEIALTRELMPVIFTVHAVPTSFYMMLEPPEPMLEGTHKKHMYTLVRVNLFSRSFPVWCSEDFQDYDRNLAMQEYFLSDKAKEYIGGF